MIKEEKYAFFKEWVKKILLTYNSMIILAYGSFFENKNSDIDLMFIKDEFSKNERKFLKNSVIELHKKLNINLDNEIPLGKKLFCTFSNIGILMSGKYPLFFDIQLTKENLSYENFIYRLFMNAIITHKKIYIGEKFLENFLNFIKTKIKNIYFRKLFLVNGHENFDKNYKNIEGFMNYKDFLGIKNLEKYEVLNFDKNEENIKLNENKFIINDESINNEYNYNYNLQEQEIIKKIGWNKKNNYFFEMGCLEMMGRLEKMFLPQNIYIFEKTFWAYSGNNVIKIKMQNALNGNIKNNFENSIFYICNPNNPTNTFWDLNKIKKISNKNKNSLIIIDETMLLFDEKWRDKSFTKNKLPKNVIVIYSLSKITGKPGLRIGIAISSNEIKKMYENKIGFTSIPNSIYEELNIFLNETNNLKLIQKQYHRNMIFIKSWNKSANYKIGYNKITNNGFIIICFISIDFKNRFLKKAHDQNIVCSGLYNYYGNSTKVRISIGNIFILEKIRCILEECDNEKNDK